VRTVTYADFKNRFLSAIGVDALLASEEAALKRSLNDRVRGAWTKAKWPELVNVLTKTAAAVSSSTLKADKAVQIDNDANLFDVWSVWDKVPWEDRTAKQIEFTLIGGYLVLPAETTETTIYVVGSQVPAINYGDGTNTLPQFLERYLLAAAIADFYRADSQNEKALVEEQRAESYLLDELDRVERLQRQNKIIIGQYQAPWPNLLITQTTV
jgi:hypothetical protein